MDNSSSTSCLPSADSAFGPIVSGCRDDFDFTIAFEQYFFSIVPSVTLLLFAPFRLRTLSRRNARVGGAAFKYTKLCGVALFAVVQLTLVILWAIQLPVGFQRASLAASTLSFVASLVFCVLSFTEHSKSLRPSILLSAYLLISLIFDAVMIRTLWLTTFDGLIRDLFTTSFALKAVILFLEAKEKREWFIAEDKLRSPEESSGIYSQSLFWWLNSMIMRGFRQVLKPDDLYRLDERMSSELLNARFWKAWNTCKPSDCLLEQKLSILNSL
jgi:ATP-binding cassette subfamily C (CFTR/MRP) protein 1